MLTVILTSSEPAWASSMHCCAVACTSGVSVFVIDCTATGAPPPICTPATFTPTVLWSLTVGMGEIHTNGVRPHLIVVLGLAPKRHDQARQRTDTRARRHNAGEVERV